MQTDPLIQRVPMTDALMAELTQVNQQINEQITYTTDLAKYGVEEDWQDAALEGNEGDCEDFAIAKLHVLRSLGFPKVALDIAMCVDETGTLHAVLVARVEGGDLCLDSRKFAVTSWDDEIASGYRFTETSVGGSFLNWRTV